MVNQEKRGILSVASELPEGRVTADNLATQFGVAPELIREKLGLDEKAVAFRDDEHPSDFCERAARKALKAAGGGPEDVGAVIYAGVSRDYLPSWSVAIETIRRLDIRNAFGYDLTLGCAGALVAMDHARRMSLAGRPPLILVVCAERWSQTLSPTVTFPLGLLAHADGGAACVIGPNAPIEFGEIEFLVRPEMNGYMMIPAGGTREPVSVESLAAGRHFRTKPEGTTEGVVDFYVESYIRVVNDSLDRISDVSRRRIDVLITNQVRQEMRQRVRSQLHVDEARCVSTYRRIGHIGSADLFIGIEEAVRRGLNMSGTTMLAVSAVSTFAAQPLFGQDGSSVAIIR